MDKNSKKFSELIYNDKALILISIVLAIIVWTIASLNIGSDETKTITVNVPINLGDELSEQVGMQYYSLQDSVDIDVSISGPKYVIGAVGKNDLSIKFDTSNVNRVGAQTIPILVTNNSSTKDFTITNTYPNSIDAYFDVSETKTLDINIDLDDYEDVLKSGYVFGNPVYSADKVLVTGPKTYVDAIESANLDFSFNGKTELREAYNTECTISFEGGGVESSYLTVTQVDNQNAKVDSIEVTIPVLKEVELPVIAQFENSPSGIKDSDFKITYSKKKLHAGIIDSADITSAVIGKINFNSLKPGENSFEFDVTALQGITPLDDVKTIKAKVTVSDDYSQYSVPIDPSAVTFEKVESGKKASIKSLSNQNIKVIAPKDTTLNSSDLVVKCDVSNKNDDGTYNLAITVKNNKAWVYSTYTADVKIK